MPSVDKTIRRSVSLPSSLARRVQTLASTKKTSTNRVVVDLIEAGLEAQEREKARFFELAERLAQSQDSEEQQSIKRELAALTFGA